MIVVNDGGSRDAQPKSFYNIVADVDDNCAASLTLGAALRSSGDFSKCDDATLFLTAAVAGFDYADAAQKLLGLAAEGIQIV